MPRKSQLQNGDENPRVHLDTLTAACRAPNSNVESPGAPGSQQAGRATYAALFDQPHTVEYRPLLCPSRARSADVVPGFDNSARPG